MVTANALELTGAEAGLRLVIVIGVAVVLKFAVGTNSP
jgi:hypothetical protein